VPCNIQLRQPNTICSLRTHAALVPQDSSDGSNTVGLTREGIQPPHQAQRSPPRDVSTPQRETRAGEHKKHASHMSSKSQET